MKIKALLNKIRRRVLSLCGISSKYISKVNARAPWVYISYIPEAIHFSFDEEYLNSHQSRREMNVIVRTFNEIGYNVYCANFNNETIVDKQFDIIFGVEPGFLAACERNPQALKIYYATGAYSTHQNTMIKKRTDEFNNTKHINYPYQRLVPEKEFLSVVDKVLQIGSKYTIETYPENFRNKITTIHQSSTMYINNKSLQKDFSNKQDILWIGGGGEILKGLDLFFEVLKNTTYNLHIVGNVNKEFKNLYSDCRNVHYYGFINVNSSEFIRICEKCNFLIYPSCTEGGVPGAVINSMYLGVIPIVSRWAAFNEIEDYGYLLDDLSVFAIRKSLEWIKQLSEIEIESLSNRCAIYAQETYNLNRFSVEFREYLMNEINYK